MDEAFGVAAGWNFFIFEAALVPFEVNIVRLLYTNPILIYLRWWLATSSSTTGAM